MARPTSEVKIAAALAKDHVPEVKNARIHHSAYRIKDPEVSLEFYRRVLGMRLQSRNDIELQKTTVYHMGYGTPENNPASDKFQWKDVAIELFHIWGSENVPDLKFSNGNDQPKGYGHIAIQVPDVYAFATRIEPLGVKFIKKPDEGNPRGIAFFQDPDGYYIEARSEIVMDPGSENPKAYNDMFKL